MANRFNDCTAWGALCSACSLAPQLLQGEPHLVANWFFCCLFIVAAMISHCEQSWVCRSRPWSPYSVFAGARDAIVQWWWGHNAVGFLLTAGGDRWWITISYPKQRTDQSIRTACLWSISGAWSAFTRGPNAPLSLLFRSHLDSEHRESWCHWSCGSLPGRVLSIAQWPFYKQRKAKVPSHSLFFSQVILYYCLATFEGPLLAIRWSQHGGTQHRMDNRPRTFRSTLDG